MPVFVHNGVKAGRGNNALLQHGAQPWLEPRDRVEFGETLSTAAATAQPKQETLALSLQEPDAAYQVASKTVLPGSPVPSADPSGLAGHLLPSEELFKTVREILRRELVKARTETEVVALLDVAKSQAKTWLTRLVEAGVLDKIPRPRPPRYRTVSSSDRLL